MKTYQQIKDEVKDGTTGSKSYEDIKKGVKEGKYSVGAVDMDRPSAQIANEYNQAVEKMANEGRSYETIVLGRKVKNQERDKAAYQSEWEQMGGDERWDELSRWYEIVAKPGLSEDDEATYTQKMQEYERMKAQREKIDTTQSQIDAMNNEKQAWQRQNHMALDYQEFQTWNKEDQEKLMRYIAHSDSTGKPDDMSYAIAMDQLAKKYGRETFERIAESMRLITAMEADKEAAAAGAGAKGFWGTVGSLPAGWLGGLVGTKNAVFGTIGDLLGAGTGRYGAQLHASGNYLSNWAESVQAATAEDAKKKVETLAGNLGASKETQEVLGKFAAGSYQVVVGAADNLARAVTTGGVGTLALAATSAFSQTYRQAAENGANSGQAAGLALVSGFLEVATEKIPLDNLLENLAKADAKSWGQILKQAAMQGGIEMTTEELNFLGGVLAEAAILREKSDYNRMVQQGVASGLSQEEAVRQADMQMIQMAGDVAVQSFFTGALMSGGGDVLNKVTNSEGSTNPLQTQAKSYQQIKEELRSKPQKAPVSPQAEQTQGASTNTQDGNPAFVSPPTSVSEAVERVVFGDPLGEAMVSFRDKGTISNKAAEKILDYKPALKILQDRTGANVDNMTVAQKRAAVKDAVKVLYEQTQTKPATEVDSANAAQYDNNTAQGGIINGTGLQQNDGAGSFGNPAQGMAGVQQPDGAEYQGRQQLGGMAVDSGVVRVSTKLSDAQSKRGTPVYPVVNTTATPQRYEQSLAEGRNSDPKNGWCVTPKTTAELAEENVRTFMNEDGTAGFGIAQNGDIVAVFKNRNGGPKKALNTLMPIAIEQGGDRLDCYGEGSVGVYAQYGFIPVARVEFNPEYANDGWTPDKGTPYIYFMMHNGDSASVVAEKMGTYPKVAQEQLNELPTYGKDDYGKAMAYRDSLLDQQANNAASAEDGIEGEAKSVGAAAKGFDPLQEAREKYGIIPEGENPYEGRVVELPKSVDGERKVSRAARTVAEAKAIPNEAVELLEEQVAKNGLTYIPIKNSDTVEKAIEYIETHGFEEAKAEWSEAVRSGKVNADLVAQGALLLNNAANAGDKKAYLDILYDYQQMATYTAQGLQAMRILKTLEPMDRLYMIEKTVKQIVQDLHLGDQIQVDDALYEAYKNAKTDVERDKVLEKIETSIAEQIPSTFMDKFTALRYLNMLGNLRTTVRNTAGNFIMKLVSDTKDLVSVALEAMVYHLSGKRLKRTKAAFVSKEQLQSAKNDYTEIQDILAGNHKFGSSAEAKIAAGIQDKRTVFKSKNKIVDTAIAKPLEGFRKATNWLMNNQYFGDVAFSRAAYARALAGYLKANGITETDYSKISTDTMDEARAFAVKEALERTFRDNNNLTYILSKRWSGKKFPKTAAVANAIADAILPFRKTPANVLLRAEEYSPLGLLNALYKTAQLKGGKASGAEVINAWAKGLTGSSLFIIGAILSNSGWISAGADEDEKREGFENLSGYQNYTLNLPGGYNYTIDWMSPAAIPVLMGAQLWELAQENGLEAKDLEKALLSITEPMIQMSMLQGINDTLDQVKYSDNSVGQLLVNAGVNYLTQGLTNTALGQVERAFESERTMTYIDKDSVLPSWAQQALGKALQKVPGVDFQQVPYINAWGEEEKNPNWAFGLAYNMLSPGYIEKGATDEVYNELMRLDDAQDDSVFPSQASKTITIDGKKRNLTSDEWVQLAKAQGKEAKRLVTSLISHADYENLDDKQKAKIIATAYEYAREKARVETLKDYKEYGAKWMEAIGNKDATEYIMRQALTGDASRYADIPISQAVYITEVLKALQDKPREAKADGTKYTSVRTVQKVEAVAGSKLTDKQQKEVYEDLLDEKTYQKYLAVLKEGFDNDQFAKSYRINSDTEGGKNKVIQKLAQEMGITYATAKTLYDIYNPPS